MALKVCAEPGCPELTAKTRCHAHERARDLARGTRQERGYDALHDVMRANYQRAMRAGQTFKCWRCGGDINPDAWHLGHDDHDRTQYRGPECPACNLATAGRANRT